jgi:hypothetical protein
MAIAADDLPQAMALAWIVWRKASGGSLRAWKITSAKSSINGEEAR